MAICIICLESGPHPTTSEMVWIGIVGMGTGDIDAHPSCFKDALQWVGSKIRQEKASAMAMDAASAELRKRDRLKPRPVPMPNPLEDRCTGLTASWCPLHGSCACPRDESGEYTEGQESDGCPLHSFISNHAEETGPPTVSIPEDKKGPPASKALANLRGDKFVQLPASVNHGACCMCGVTIKASHGMTIRDDGRKEHSPSCNPRDHADGGSPPAGETKE